MSIFEKTDRARHRRDINLCRPVSQPDATGFSVAEPDATPNPAELSYESSQGPAIPAKTVTSIGNSMRLGPLRPPITKSTEA